MAGNNTTVTFEGLDTLAAIVKELPKNANKFLANELYDIAVDAFNESQKQVPVRYGALRGSGTVTVDEGAGQVEITISYGGGSAGYALAVHENLAAKHKPPTKAKYLEDPVNAAMAGADSRMQAHVEGAIIGQFPGGAGSGLTGSGGGGRGVSGGRRRSGTKTHRPMTTAEVHRALATIDKGREMERKGRRGIRTWHRATG